MDYSGKLFSGNTVSRVSPLQPIQDDKPLDTFDVDPSWIQLKDLSKDHNPVNNELCVCEEEVSERNRLLDNRKPEARSCLKCQNHPLINGHVTERPSHNSFEDVTHYLTNETSPESVV